MYQVRSGDETEIRLRPIDMEGHAMTATITTQPGSGKLYQLSHVYNQYGYEPKKGAQILTSPSQTATGSNFRLLYAPPVRTRTAPARQGALVDAHRLGDWPPYHTQRTSTSHACSRARWWP